MIDLVLERTYWVRGIRVAGVDEAGRGPLAGPVVAAAVVFPHNVWIEGIDDSKKLPPEKRAELFPIILQNAISYGLGTVSHTVIDEINIYQASLRAMQEAVSRLAPTPDHLLIDGRACGEQPISSTPIIDGDAQCFSIAAASIIAKVTRDRLMVQLDRQYPEYGFAKHKGYGTKEHYEALRKFGPCDIHRRSFRLEPDPLV